MAGIDMNRTTTGAPALLPREISTEIWSKTIEQSTVMTLSDRMDLPAGGKTIPIITGDPEADWVAETEESPVGDSTLGSKNIRGYKLSVTEAFSNEFKRDLPGLYAELARRLPLALGKKFDQTVLHGTAPGTDFDVLSDIPVVTVDNADTAGDFQNAFTTVALAGGDLSGWALSPQAEAIAMGARNERGDYLFIPNAREGGQVGTIFGRPVHKSKGVYAPATGSAAEILGVAGDFSSARVGIVSDISVSISSEATINKGGVQLNLWQRGMFAIKAEFEVGYAIRDKAHFVRLGGTAATGA